MLSQPPRKGLGSRDLIQVDVQIPFGEAALVADLITYHIVHQLVVLGRGMCRQDLAEFSPNIGMFSDRLGKQNVNLGWQAFSFCLSLIHI